MCSLLIPVLFPMLFIVSYFLHDKINLFAHRNWINRTLQIRSEQNNEKKKNNLIDVAHQILEICTKINFDHFDIECKIDEKMVRRVRICIWKPLEEDVVQVICVHSSVYLCFICGGHGNAWL